MADAFYPFVENPSTPPHSSGQDGLKDRAESSQNSHISGTSEAYVAAEKPAPTQPDGPDNAVPSASGAHRSGVLEVTSAARIAVYDDVAAAPRVVMVAPQDIRSYLEEITATVNKLAQEQGGAIPFTVIRECVENLIHAYFQAPTISILDGGNTIRFSDQGPGIPNKRLALEYGTSSATESMKRYIRGVGSGLPYASQYMADKGGTLTIEDNISGGCIVTISLSQIQEPQDPAGHRYAPSAAVAEAGVSRQPEPLQSGFEQPRYGQVPQNYPYGQPQTPGYGAMPGQIAQPVFGQPQPGWGQPAYGQPLYGQPSVPGYGQPSYGTPVLSGYPSPTETPGMSQGQTPYVGAGIGAGYGGEQPSQMPLGDGSISDRDRNALMYLLQHSEGGGAELTAAFGSSGPTWSRTLKHLSELGFVQKHGQKYRLTEVGRQWTIAHWL